MPAAYTPKAILHGLATATALLTCFAVVLHPGLFASAPKREAARTIAQPQMSGLTAEPGADVARVESSEPVRAETEAVPQTSAAVAPPASRSEPQAPPAVVLASFELASSSDQSAPATTRSEQAPEPVSSPSLVGVWAPNASGCSAQGFRKGLLPTIINTEGAWAGSTSCLFKKRDETESGWSVLAHCSNARERWTARIQLSVKGDQLLWTSKQGTQTYARCTSNFLVAATR